MIIIVTKNGNQYVNDKAVVSVSHSIKLAEAYVTPIGDTPRTQVFKNVEQVIYVSDSEKVTIKEDGGDLHDLKKKYDNLAAYNDRLRSMVFLLMNEHPDIYDEINEKVIKKLGDGSKG
jgi:hypothetical protein